MKAFCPSLAFVGALSAVAGAGANAEPLARADVTVRHSQLSEDLPDWREATFAYSRRLGEGWSAALRVEVLERFERDDVYTQVRVDRTLGDRSFYVAAGGAPDADFRPEIALAAGMVVPLPGDAGRTNLSLDVDASRFVLSDVITAKAGVDRRLGPNGLRGGLRAIVVSEDGDAALLGFAIESSAPITRRISVRLGYADAPETSEGAVVRVRGWSGGILFDVNDRWLIRVDLAREDRGVYRRNEVALAMAWRI